MENFTFHHIGIAVRDLKFAIASYESVFGYRLLSGPFNDPIQGVAVCFMRMGAGDPTIELVAPLGPGSPVDRVLKRGGGTYHMCYEVPDLNKAIDEMRERNAILLGEPAPAVAFGMRNIAWLMSDDANLLVELLQT